MSHKPNRYAIFFMSDEQLMSGLDLKIVGPFKTDEEATRKAEAILRERGIIDEDMSLAEFQDVCSGFAHVYLLKSPEDVR